jgi:hypothetical protein
VKPLESFPVQEWRKWDKGPDSGEPVISFADTKNPHYRKMLEIIQAGRESALKNPRLDMPGGRLHAFAGRHRNIYPVRIPEKLPHLKARQLDSGEVEIEWGLTKYTWGLVADVYRGEKADFEIADDKKISSTELGWCFDRVKLSAGVHHYAVVFDNGDERSGPFRVEVEVDAAEDREFVGRSFGPARAAAQRETHCVWQRPPHGDTRWRRNRGRRRSQDRSNRTPFLRQGDEVEPQAGRAAHGILRCEVRGKRR